MVVTRPAAFRAWRAVSIWPAGWLWFRAWLIWLRVSPAGCCAHDSVDLLSERIAGRAGQRPRRGPGGVVLQRERSGQVRGGDLALAVGEGVDEREPDHVRLSAGGDLADDSVAGLRSELAIGVMPQLTRVRVEPDLAGCACLS